MLPPREIGLAAAAWQVEPLPGWEAMAAKLSHGLGVAATAGTDIAVLPEYAGLEAAMAVTPAPLDVPGWCARAAEVAPDYAALCAGLAARHGLWLLSGSMPARHGAALVNRAWLCTPEGAAHPVDKQILTPWERAATPLQPGLPPQVFETPFGRLGVLICYDSEFPQLSRALGADILLIPSVTETQHGLTRVRTAARARALEGQCLTLHAPLVGATPGCGIIAATRGRAGIFAPPDVPFPPDGILAQTEPEAAGWALARVAAGRLTQNRQIGAVAPRAHAAEAQARAALTVVTLRHQVRP